MTWKTRVLDAFRVGSSLLGMLLLLQAALNGAQSGGRTPERALARQIIEATGVEGGLVAHLGCGDGKLTAALLLQDPRGTSGSYLVHGLDADPHNVEAARRYLRSLGVYGKASVEQLEGNRLPYADNLVNLLVSEDLGGVSMDEVMRVLAPLGVAYVKSDDAWKKTVKPWPAEIDEWTHFLHDASGNAVAQDSRVGPPRHLQWRAGPLFCRSHETDPSVGALVSARGRIFYFLDEGPTGIIDPRLPSQWTLVARDAFSGVLLWKLSIPDWGWAQWSPSWKRVEWNRIPAARLQIPCTVARRLVAVGDKLYVTLGYRAPVSVLDAATGRVVKTLDATRAAEEILDDQGVLVLSVRQRPAAATTGKRNNRNMPGEEEICSVMAVRPETGEVLWKHGPDGMACQTLAAADGHVVYHNTKDLVCLDEKTGAELWRAACPVQDSLRNATNATVVTKGGAVSTQKRADGL